MLKKIYIPLFIILIGLNACTQGNPDVPTPTSSSGIEVFVTQGPMCPGPVQLGDTSCPDQPYQANITILDADNTQITQFQSDTNGYYKLPLAPGTYILHPTSGKPLPQATDQTVVVIEGQFTQVSIVYDTGIR
ncbi:MAG: hypothetical protein A2Y53_08485 [Chloroflexi bacterium RBG_16_47_49]|nr:MAG: hypothetical protein A2Y53_08485 [Chloroflexi bacterium RBG_16_47_49]